VRMRVGVLSLGGVGIIYKRTVEDRTTCSYFTEESGLAKMRNASIMLGVDGR
jgi:hypothetical protein